MLFRSLTAFARTILDDANAAAVLATIGASATTHRHDTHTLQHDAVTSDGGDFPFTTAGDFQHIMGTGNAVYITDVTTDDTDKKPGIRSFQEDSGTETEGFTVIYVEAT